MDKSFLEDYWAREHEDFLRYKSDFLDIGLSKETAIFPNSKRFIKLQKPIALITEHNLSGQMWSQIPYAGSSVLQLVPVPKDIFEEIYFKISEIPKIIDFIKETGRLQIIFTDLPTKYTGLNFLDPFFKELSPPTSGLIPLESFDANKEQKKYQIIYDTLASIKYYDYLYYQVPSRLLQGKLKMSWQTFTFLNLVKSNLVKRLENLLIDNPEEAVDMLTICRLFIEEPARDLLYTVRNHTIGLWKHVAENDIVVSDKPSFPVEIGSFLMNKLTYAPQGLRACYYLLDNYASYDLLKLQKALNDAIINNQTYPMYENAKEIGEVLDNVWTDKKITNSIKGFKVGVPVSMAAVGSFVAQQIGGISGLLAGLGINVIGKLASDNSSKLGEIIAKPFLKNYQVNVYDFKKRYRNKIVT